MDSYGVIEFGQDSALSIPGLIFYLIVLSISITLSIKLVDFVIPSYYSKSRKVNYFTAGVSSAIIATWVVINLGLWFYLY